MGLSSVLKLIVGAASKEAVEPQKLKQLMYRGRTSEVLPSEDRALYMSPQRRYAEAYADK